MNDDSNYQLNIWNNIFKIVFKNIFSTLIKDYILMEKETSHEENKPKIKITLKVLNGIENKPKIKLQLRHDTECISPKKSCKNLLKPYWNQKTALLSRLFWSPTKENCMDLTMKIPIQSWVSTLIQKQKDGKQSSDYLIHMLPKTSHVDSDMICRKIRLFPETDDKVKLKKIFGACRYVYNHGIDLIQSSRETFLSKGKTEEGSLLQRLRTNIVHNHNYQEDELNWMLTDLPSDSRDSVIRELHTNYWNGLTTDHRFELKKRSKKKSQSVTIRLRDYNKRKGFYSFIGSIDKAELFPEPEHDLKLQMDIDGHYYLLVPYQLNSTQPLSKLQKCVHRKKKPKLKLKKKKRKNQRHQRVNLYQKKKSFTLPEDPVSNQFQMFRDESQIPITSERSLSGDLGVRTFITCYTPDGYVYHIGKNDIRTLYSLFYFKNKLQGRMSKETGRRKRRMRKAWIRASKRIHNLVNDFHKKTAGWMLKNFNILIIPKLDVNQFRKKKTSKSTRNKMRIWRHCSFIDCLKNMQRRFPSCSVIIPTEEFTSKTCSHCGCLHQTLGRNKTFQCPNPTCQQIFDRDVNASLNILLKTLTEATSVAL
jgi:transposase